jgi:hypothetical protein
MCWDNLSEKHWSRSMWIIEDFERGSLRERGREGEREGDRERGRERERKRERERERERERMFICLNVYKTNQNLNLN